MANKVLTAFMLVAIMSSCVKKEIEEVAPVTATNPSGPTGPTGNNGGRDYSNSKADFIRRHSLPVELYVGKLFGLRNTSTPHYSSSFWDFGDGTFSTEDHPDKAYQTAGWVTISLTMTWPDGTKDAVTKQNALLIRP